MPDTPDDPQASYIRGIETKTGKPIDALLAQVDAWGPGKHGELLARAKEEFGLGHGHANLLIHLARERAKLASQGTADSTADPLDAIYTGSKASLRPLHEAVMARFEVLGAFDVAPKKSYVSLRRRKQFATVGPGSRGRLEIGVNHRSAPGTERFEELGPGKMCSHRVFLTTPEEIDDELLAFVRGAYEAAG